MAIRERLVLKEIERQICDMASEHLNVPRDMVMPESRMLEDLHCDSLDLIELIMEIEDRFKVELRNQGPGSVYKSFFTRNPFRLLDLAEIVYVLQETGCPTRNLWGRINEAPRPADSVPFTQLDGHWRRLEHVPHSLFDGSTTLGDLETYRRRSDGMRCILIPRAEVEIGSPDVDAQPDEQPLHTVTLDPFLIDAEPVSTTAYSRFLNSVNGITHEDLLEWFLLTDDDHRRRFELLQQVDTEWRPRPGTEQLPMMLVSWFGAHAYALWANGRDWQAYRDDADSECDCFLPSEAQWEYAARGAKFQRFPWGQELPSSTLLQCGPSDPAAINDLEDLPLVSVHAKLGMSPFGLHHMAGNVWQWCRDWYQPDFYATPEASVANAVQRRHSGVRSERGGSWVGPADLCRSSYRRGRNPSARGRCLGFRCISLVTALN